MDDVAAVPDQELRRPTASPAGPPAAAWPVRTVLDTGRGLPSSLPAVALLGIAVLLEVTYVVGLLLPLSLVRLPGPQLAGEPIAAVLGYDATGLGRFLLLAVILFSLYFGALTLLPRVSARHLVMIGSIAAVLFAATLVPTIAMGSNDLYHYILEGRILAIHHANPYVVPPSAFPQDKLYGILVWNTGQPGSYGSLQYLLEGGAALLGQNDLVWSTITFKSLSLLWFVGSLPLVYGIAQRLRPGFGPAALVVFGWNPFVIFEALGSGHNDIGVAFFTLLALYLAVSGRWQWSPLAVILAASIKITGLLILPALAVWLLLRPHRPALRSLAGAFGGAAAVAVASLIPFWQGMSTFDNLLQYHANVYINSLAGAAVWVFPAHYTASEALMWVKLIVLTGFFIIGAAILLRHRGPEPAALVGGAFWSVFAYYTLVSWWFWPWYVISIVALGATLWPDRPAKLAVIFSAGAFLLTANSAWYSLLFAGPPDSVGRAVTAALVGFMPALLYWASGWWDDRGQVGAHP